MPVIKLIMDMKQFLTAHAMNAFVSNFMRIWIDASLASCLQPQHIAISMVYSVVNHVNNQYTFICVERYSASWVIKVEYANLESIICPIV